MKSSLQSTVQIETLKREREHTAQTAQTADGHRRKGQRKWVWPAEAAVLKVTKAKFFLNLQPCLQLHSLSPRLATEREFSPSGGESRKQSLFPKANDKD